MMLVHIFSYLLHQKRALETPQDGPIGKYTTKRKVTDTYADEEEYDGLDNFYDMHDDSLRPRLTPL